MDLILKPVNDSDIVQLEFWLNKEHVLKWYHDANEWLDEIRKRHDEFRFLNHFMVLNGNEAFGFCQYYDCFDAQEDWYDVKCPHHVFSIDYFIGDETYLRKGYGKAIVNKLLQTIKTKWKNVEVIVQPEKENIASCKALSANGFVYDENRECYYLKMLDT